MDKLEITSGQKVYIDLAEDWNKKQERGLFIPSSVIKKLYSVERFTLREF